MNDVIKYLPPYVASSNAFLKQKMVVFAVIFLKQNFILTAFPFSISSDLLIFFILCFINKNVLSCCVILYCQERSVILSMTFGIAGNF
jgi:hypothetical protein